MPIYVYECCKCKNKVEVIEKMNDKEIYEEPCKKCKSDMKKIISNTTFHLKGGGWYKTDYRNVINNGEIDPDIDKMVDEVASGEIVKE